MEIVVDRFEQSIRVRSYDVDFYGNLTMPALCNYFQEIAWEHAQKLNIGYKILLSLNKFWVLSRLQVKIFEYPKWTDEIKLITWPKGIDGMFALRDFVILNKDGKKLVAATSSWLILDIERHRPQKIDSDDHPKYLVDQTDAYIPLAEKIPAFKNMEPKSSFCVEYTDIDINKHVNNVKYIEWAINTQTNELTNGSVIDEMMVNFMGEASLNDEMNLTTCQETNYCGISVYNTTRKKESCRIKFIYK
jgi:acyl-ACP thioesterase